MHLKVKITLKNKHYYIFKHAIIPNKTLKFGLVIYNSV